MAASYTVISDIDLNCSIIGTQRQITGERSLLCHSALFGHVVRADGRYPRALPRGVGVVVLVVIHADRGNIGARAAASRAATVMSQRRQAISR